MQFIEAQSKVVLIILNAPLSPFYKDYKITHHHAHFVAFLANYYLHDLHYWNHAGAIDLHRNFCGTDFIAFILGPYPTNAQ